MSKRKRRGQGMAAVTVEPVVDDPYAAQRNVIALNATLAREGKPLLPVPRLADLKAATAMERDRAERRADEAERTRHRTMLRPTRETEEKWRPDPLKRMLESGSLTEPQGWAADQIHEIYSAVVAGILSRPAPFSRRSPGKAEMAEKLAQWHTDHYLPWAWYLGGKPDGEKGRCPVALELTIDVVIDGKSLAQCERERGWRRAGTASEVLRYALAAYADIAGWERNRSVMAAFEMMLGRKRVAI